MALKRNADVITKKVSPFPIAATLTENTVIVPVSVVKMTETGVMVSLSSQVVTIGRHYKIKFVLPVFKQAIEATITAVKIYNQARRGAGYNRLAELHFHQISIQHQEYIKRFLTRIRAKDPSTE